MNLQSSQRVAYEQLRSLGFADISGTYAGVGLPFANPVRLITIDNTTNINLIISFDGVNDHTFVASNTGRVLDYCSNKNDLGGNLEQPAYTRLYVKQESGAAAEGNVYVSVVYASQD